MGDTEGTEREQAGESVEDLLREGVAAAHAGQRERARRSLLRVVETDEACLEAWLWLSSVVDDLEERAICLENVLTLDPDHAAARRGLAWIDAQRAEAEATADATPKAAAAASRGLAWVRQQGADDAAGPGAIHEPPSVARTRTPISLAAAVLRDDRADRAPHTSAAPSGASASCLQPRAAKPTSPPVPLPDAFDDPYLCPTCASPTEPDDRRCGTCRGRLWVRFHAQEKRSLLLWVLLSIQIINTYYLGMYILALLVYVGLKVDAMNPTALLNAYLGFPSPLAPETVDAALAIVPRAVFATSTLPLLFSLAVTVGLYMRWKPVYYLFLADAGLGLVAALVGGVLLSNVPLGIAGLVLSLLRFLFLFRLGDDFAQKKMRILLRLDPGLGSSMDCIARARVYEKRGMWALAAIHLRKGVTLSPSDVDCHMSLAMAYIRLKRYDKAARTLAEIERIRPGDERIGELASLLAELRRESGQAHARKCS